MELAVREVEALGLDPERFRAFYEDALPRIYGYFLHRCGGSVPVAEDLTQETFSTTTGGNPGLNSRWLTSSSRSTRAPFRFRMTVVASELLRR